MRFPLVSCARVTPPDAPASSGRSPAWRLGMAAAGIGFLAAGAVLVVWPALLAWAAAAGLAAVGLLLVASALFARGRGGSDPAGARAASPSAGPSAVPPP